MAKKNPEIPGLERVWGKVFGLMKIVTGNVDVLNKGSLQEQIDKCLDSKGDSQNLTVTYNSGDSRTANAWTDVDVMTSKETHKSLFGKISTMFKNVRYLYRLLGTTDISQFGGGTVTGAIKDLEDSKPDLVSKTKSGLAPQLPNETDTKKYLRQDGTWAVPPDNNTTYNNFVKSGSEAKAGLVPAPGTTAGTTKYLREDGTWAVPPDNNTTYSNMTAATANAAGKAGLVPAPAAGAQAKYLRGDGTWQTPPDTKTTITQSAAVTEVGKMAMDAVEKNAAVPGTMAYELAQLNSNMEFYSGGTPSSEINTLRIWRTNEFIIAGSGAKLYKTVFGGYIDMGAYAVAGEEKYLGYVNNPYPSNPGAVPIPIPCMIKTYSDDVTQDAVMYIKGNGGVYLSVPPTLKSTGFAVVVLPTCEQYCYYH